MKFNIYILRLGYKPVGRPIISHNKDRNRKFCSVSKNESIYHIYTKEEVIRHFI